MRAMILAAGLGTRLKPWTDLHPKALAPVNGKSLLQRNVEYLQQFGIRDIIVNVHHFPAQIIQAIESNNGWGSHISISDESDEVLETGGGLLKASVWLNRPGSDFLVMNVDILTDLDLSEMILFHRQWQPLATLAVTARQTSRYFLFDENDELSGWKNIKTGETRISRPALRSRPLAFSGIHIINASFFDNLPFVGKFSLVDAYLEIAGKHRIKGFDHSGTLLIDVGKPEALITAAQFFL